MADIMELKRFATPRQWEVLQAIYSANGSYREAARALDTTHSSVSRMMARLRAVAARQGYAPEYDLTKPVPRGLGLNGVSTLYDDEGNVKLQWVKSGAKRQQELEAFRQAMDEFAEDYKGVAKRTKAPKVVAKEYCTLYGIGDAHIGSYAWGEETDDEDYDADIAVAYLHRGIDVLVESTPDAEEAIVANVGDFFHADNLENTTTRGTVQDVDTRWSRVIRLGCSALRYMVDSALQKHKRVYVECLQGNHDKHTSMFLTMWLAAVYEKEPRVVVDQSPSPYRYHVFGKNLVGVTHGDTAKKADLGSIMATDRPKEWGETQHRIWITGHIHHKTVEEQRGCTVESLRTLAAKDAWTHSAGYRSQRDMVAIVLHKEFGETSRHTANIARVRG